MNKTLLLLVLLGLTTFVLADVVIDTSVYEKATKCHESCFCEQTDTKCAECNICTSCRHPTAHIIENSYCVCDTPRYVQGRTKEDNGLVKKLQTLYLFVIVMAIIQLDFQYGYFQTVKFTDDRGVYSYNKNTQWWQINQQKGLVDVKVLLWQPQVNCKVEVTLKITLQPDSRLRALSAESTTGKVTKQNFQIEVAQSSTKNAQLENNSSFSAKLFCGLILAALALLF
ncbi:hypothetical protein IMG5_102200 [Ichthyophthirius multifiliis]|uniref:Uncharacterized protein n=1 Tax=Ichthyophthirius multifiliis TaxID=5932 RepID=G0QSM2_ICHMU|nr:hypothetical protein IMG5_102200 [Ichthyophthirius multifiliis]EGR31781.1 hypothetical protein IMG5_102200 [Ichthyophthirius multifiliis]|eukprot:XP_004035267.1 hypothetical protein IMG5_102200 [Ichthyophthirius multifiliis]